MFLVIRRVRPTPAPRAPPVAADLDLFWLLVRSAFLGSGVRKLQYIPKLKRWVTTLQQLSPKATGKSETTNTPVSSHSPPRHVRPQWQGQMGCLEGRRSEIEGESHGRLHHQAVRLLRQMSLVLPPPGLDPTASWTRRHRHRMESLPHGLDSA